MTAAANPPITAAPPVQAAAAALAAGALPVASDLAAGYTVTRLSALGPDRAAVRWLPPDPAPGYASQPGPGLARCRAALQAAGCRCYFVVAPGGGFLAVLAPAPPAGADRR